MLMNASYFADFRSYIDELEKRGKLYRWKRPVNKDMELMPLMRLQYRGIADEKRKAFLFENVFDSRGKKHRIKVATGMYGSSRTIAALGLGCDEPLEIYEKWRQGLAKPIDPSTVAHAAVQEEVYTGAKLKEFGLTSLPAPVEEPGFSGGIRVTAPFITKDPETGKQNVGIYNGHILREEKIIAGIARPPHSSPYYHPNPARRNKPPPPAIVLCAVTAQK